MDAVRPTTVEWNSQALIYRPERTQLCPLFHGDEGWTGRENDAQIQIATGTGECSAIRENSFSSDIALNTPRGAWTWLSCFIVRKQELAKLSRLMHNTRNEEHLIGWFHVSTRPQMSARKSNIVTRTKGWIMTVKYLHQDGVWMVSNFFFFFFFLLLLLLFH
jgi:hypothetical protein